MGGGQIGAESGRSSRCKQQGGGCVVLCRSVSVQLYGRILLRTTGKGPHIRIDEYEYSRTAVLYRNSVLFMIRILDPAAASMHSAPRTAAVLYVCTYSYS